MATIATLAVSLTARTSRFNRKMRGAKVSVHQFGEKVTHTARRVLGFGTALAAAATGGGLALLTKRAFESMDAVAKTSDKLGLATEELIGLRHAAKQSGVAVNTFDMGIQRMVRRVSEAAHGTGEAQDAIKELGLDAKQLGQLGTREQFYAIADAMQQVQKQSDRVRLSFKLFDSEGVALVNTLRGGSDALDEFQRDAERLGITFSRIDAGKIEAANDAIDRLRKVLGGAAQVLAVQLAPFVKVLSDKIVQVAVDGNYMGESVVNAFEAILRGIGRAADHLELLKAGWLYMKAAATGTMAGILTALEWADRGLTDLFNWIERGARQAWALFAATAIGGVADLVDAVKWADEKLTDLFNKIPGLAAEYNESLQSASKTLREMENDALLRAAGVFDSPGKASSHYNTTIAAWAQTLREQLDGAFADAEASLAKFLAGTHSGALKLWFDKVKREAVGAAEAFTEALADVPDLDMKKLAGAAGGGEIAFLKTTYLGPGAAKAGPKKQKVEDERMRKDVVDKLEQMLDVLRNLKPSVVMG